MLLITVYNVHVDGSCNIAVQLCVLNWFLDAIGETVSLCDWLRRWDDVNHWVPAAWAAVGFRVPCQYINIANSSTQYSTQHTPISHLWIAWTYSDSLCCCAFRVTPIAVSGTARGSVQNWAQTVGFRHFEIGRNICSTKKTPKSVQTRWRRSRYKLLHPRDLEWGSETLRFTYKFWSFSSASIFVKIHLKLVILKLRVNLLHLLERFVAGIHLPKLHLLMWLRNW